MKQNNFKPYDPWDSSLQERRRLVLPLAIGMVAAMILGSPLGTYAATAKECIRQTPLPANARLIAPGKAVPKSYARFAGAWLGAWMDKETDALCHTLVVEEVFANGFARVIYSVGTYAGWNIRQPNFWRVTGRITDGVLRFHLPVPSRPSLAYRFGGEMLQGTFNAESQVSLARVAALRQLNCGSQVRGATQAPIARGPRDRLKADELLAPTYSGDGPVHNGYFLPVGLSAPALHTFKGSLTVGAWSTFSANHGCTGLATTSPAFSVAFFTHGEHLVPAVRDIVQPPGTMIVSPGKVWSEPGDRGMSRASFPFVLVNQSNNAAHNGLATFLYDETRVSALRLQVVQETAAWAKIDFWGQAPLTYTPSPLPNEDALGAQFAAELKRQTPIRPWSELPTSRTSPLERFDGDAVPADITANGLIVDGIIYLRSCNTRYGPYPCGR
jgi:hypothetical protein